MYMLCCCSLRVTRLRGRIEYQPRISRELQLIMQSNLARSIQRARISGVHVFKYFYSMLRTNRRNGQKDYMTS